MANLLILLKDDRIPASEFSHLADIVVFNQWVERPNSLIVPSFKEFEANIEEMEKLSWFTRFAQKDVIYILDKHVYVRERMAGLVEHSTGDLSDLGGVYREADIVLVQVETSIYCIKNRNGNHPVLRFACEKSHTAPADQVRSSIKITQARDAAHKYMATVRRQAHEIRISLLESFGATCEKCGYDTSLAALNFYMDDTFADVRPISVIAALAEAIDVKTANSFMQQSRVTFIQFGKVRPFEDIYAEVEKAHILCNNCALAIIEKRLQM
jgi:hypothetical protein